MPCRRFARARAEVGRKAARAGLERQADVGGRSAVATSTTGSRAKALSRRGDFGDELLVIITSRVGLSYPGCHCQLRYHCSDCNICMCAFASRRLPVKRRHRHRETRILSTGDSASQREVRRLRFVMYHIGKFRSVRANVFVNHDAMIHVCRNGVPLTYVRRCACATRVWR